MNDYNRFAQIVENSQSAVFFGGAGVSAASGIPDFRSANGIFKRDWGEPAELLLSRTYFDCYPEKFFDFYRVAMLYPDARPNLVHYTLAALEKRGILKAVITQNIDGLHQEAGSRKVLELHGSVHRNRCMNCGKSYNLEYITSTKGIPKCQKCGATVKPEVVLYEEALPSDVFGEADQLVAEADTLIVAGTSLSVYPAANFVYSFCGKNLIIVNKDETPADGEATLVLRGDMTEVFATLSKLS